MHWIYTPHDPLWEQCQKSIYCQIVRRYADGSPGFRDEEWLSEALSSLRLSREGFNDDAKAIREGHEPARLRGEWDESPQLDVQQVDDEGISELGETATWQD